MRCTDPNFDAITAEHRFPAPSFVSRSGNCLLRMFGAAMRLGHACNPARILLKQPLRLQFEMPDEAMFFILRGKIFRYPTSKTFIRRISNHDGFGFSFLFFAYFVA
jgi:hypothetical protein